MSAKQVVTIVGAAAAAFVGWFQYHYNVHKRKVLDSNQSMFYNSNSFHTITALVPSGELKIMFDHSDSEKLKYNSKRNRKNMHKIQNFCTNAPNVIGNLLKNIEEPCMKNLMFLMTRENSFAKNVPRRRDLQPKIDLRHTSSKSMKMKTIRLPNK